MRLNRWWLDDINAAQRIASTQTTITSEQNKTCASNAANAKEASSHQPLSKSCGLASWRTKPTLPLRVNTKSLTILSGGSAFTRLMTDSAFQILAKNCETVLNKFPKEAEQVNKILSKSEDTLCLWHKKDQPGHKGKFGLMHECLDCMKEIQKGRCAIDVKNFNFDVYWQVKKFWEKVEIRKKNDCWHWIGATKKNNTETAAYMPSPAHSGRIQSAARVAFWTSRGYTGRMRVFHQPGCDMLCCNPLHLRLRELESVPVPTKISVVNLSYGNIFDHAKSNNA